MLSLGDGFNASGIHHRYVLAVGRGWAELLPCESLWEISVRHKTFLLQPSCILALLPTTMKASYPPKSCSKAGEGSSPCTSEPEVGSEQPKSLLLELHQSFYEFPKPIKAGTSTFPFSTPARHMFLSTQLCKDTGGTDALPGH